MCMCGIEDPELIGGMCPKFAGCVCLCNVI